MNTDTQPLENSEQENAEPRTRGRLQLVRCAGSTFLAYQDADGKWISYFERKELDDALEVLTGS
jgi:hypothetical protein